MYRFTKTVTNITGHAGRQVAVRHVATNASRAFHAKYGLPLLVTGATFCTAVWTYVITSTGITWNLSPIGKVQPKEWNE